ncbi:MAG: hypothetical protein ACMUIG_00510 [Thermoplasmatota archaeon]
MAKSMSFQKKVKFVMVPVLMAIILAVPAFQAGSGIDEDPVPTRDDDEDNEMFTGSVDLGAMSMEQYISGEEKYDNFGYSMAKGDINGDDLEDIIIGAPGFNGSRGGVFVFYGGSKGREMSYEDADVVIDHHEDYTYFGLNVEVGDVDGDGNLDILASGYTDDQLGPGPLVEYPKVFLFLGKNGWAHNISTAEADTVYIGSDPTTFFGYKIGLGDVTSDGYDDVVVTEIEAGAVAGSMGSGIDYDTNIALDATASHSGGGSGVWGPDRLNNGDYTGVYNDCWTSGGGWVELVWEDEVQVAAMTVLYTRYRTLSASYCLDRCDVKWWDGSAWQLDHQYRTSAETGGVAGTVHDNYINMTEPRKTTRVRLENMNSGSNIMIQEWLVFGGGGSKAYVGSPNGTMYIFEGGPILQSSYNVSLGANPGGYDHFINNTANNSGFATTDLDLGDINGDGYEDILIGSGGIQYEGIESGSVQVILGGANLPKMIDLYTYSHLNITSFPGYRLSYVTHADITGDGIQDLIVVAPGAFFDKTGGIFAYKGKKVMPTGQMTILNYDFMIRGPREDWEFNVEGAGDLDGDGKEDLWIRSGNGEKTGGGGIYYLLYMKEVAKLPDPTVYNMKFETPTFKVVAPKGKSSFGSFLRNGLMTLDFNNDDLEEIVLCDYDGSFQGKPTESGLVSVYYPQVSEILVEKFELTDPDGIDEYIVGAEKVYHFQGSVLNTWSYGDIKSMDLKFHMHGTGYDGQSLDISWNMEMMNLVERNDLEDFINIESSSVVQTSNYGLDFYLNLSFNSHYPLEDALDVGLYVDSHKGDLLMSKVLPGLFRVEVDVDFFGELTVSAEKNGVLARGSYVQPNEKIVVTGIRAVYEGTLVSPPNTYFSIKMEDNLGNIFLNQSSSGLDIYFTYRTQPMAGREEVKISIVDLKQGVDDMSGQPDFYYIVDTDLPPAPEGLTVHADSDVDPLMGYDNDPDVWVLWNPTQDATSEIIGYMYSMEDAGGTDMGTFTQNTFVEVHDLQEGWNTIYVWSVDSAQNYGLSSDVSVYYDTEMPMFALSNPKPGSWINTNLINYEMFIFDNGQSGVRGSSIEYTVSNDGGKTYGAWEPTNIRRNGDQITVKLFINFREGEDNFIKWRAMDVAGNGYAVSDPYQIKVDTVPITFRSATPSDAQDVNYVKLGITLGDSGSGVDAGTIQYQLSHDGVSNYGPWESMGLSGSYESITVETPPIYFEKDTQNYVKWRAKDIAGNGFTYSTDILIDINPEVVNGDPVPIISNPVSGDTILESSRIVFDGSESLDPDGDEVKYLWYSDKDGYLGTDPVIERYLSANSHRITLHLDDGLSNRSITVDINVLRDYNAIDTDKDGIPDFIDDDDDNDGLLDSQEDLNNNGVFDYLLNETDMRKWDTDGDGASDFHDALPLDPDNYVKENEDEIPWWVLLIIVLAIIVSIVIIILFAVLKMRSDRERIEAARSLRRKRKSLKRYEVLTGIPTNDLPAIEAIQWALPGVISEASEFVLEPAPTDDLLPPKPEEEFVPPADMGGKPDLEDLEVPAPDVDVPFAADSVHQEPPSEPVSGESVPSPSGARVINCSLCGSEVPVDDGASTAECPLCGEIINL